MARIRSIHPDACDSEKLAQLSHAAERLFWRFQTHCDDDGRCDDNVRLIAAKCVPLLDWDHALVDGLLDELEQVGLLVRYEVAGKRYVQVAQWDRFQKPRKPQRGKRPAPVANHPTHTDTTGSPQEDAPVANEYATSTDHEDTSVAQGEEWSGEEWRPPKGGGGSRGEGGNSLRGGRQRPFTEDAAVNPTVARLGAKLAEAEAKFGAVS